MSDFHPRRRILLIAMGNPNRGDDALGCVMSERLQDVVPDAVEMVDYDGDGAGLMALWDLEDWVYIVDAVASGAEPGTRYVLDAKAEPLHANFFHYSSHAFGLSEGVEMARVLDRMPERLMIFGIEGQDYTLGHPVSEAVLESSFELQKELIAALCNAVQELEPHYA